MTPAPTIPAAALALLGQPYRTPARPGQRELDCSVFVASVLKAAYPLAPWTRAIHADLMIRDAARPWSPMDAVVAAGIGEVVEAPVVGRWHVCQGWRGLVGGKAVLGRSHGHAWLWWSGAEGERILEATPVARDWYRAATWATQRSGFGEVRMCALVPA